MKRILSAAVLLATLVSTGFCYAAETVKTTPKEYYKYAGTAADPGYQDYIATSNKASQKNDSGSYAAQREQMKDRAAHSPKVSYPMINHKGTYGQAK